MKLHKTYSFNIVTAIVVTMFFACQSNYNEVQKLGISENEPIGVAEHINLKYTDSGRVTANLKSPIMLDYSNRDFSYHEFTEGITLYLFDENNNKTTVVSDYAISYNETNIIDLQGHIKVGTNAKDTLFAQQLYYDTKKEWLFTNMPVQFKTGADIIKGNGFDSDSKFKNAEVLEVTGLITVD